MGKIGCRMKKMETDNSDLDTFIKRFQPYVAELRTHLVIVAILCVIGCVLGLVFSQQILNYFLHLFNFNGISIVSTSPYQFIDISFSISLVIGVLLAAPYALVRTYFFVKPALKASERRFIIRFLPLSLVLFCFGFYFGLWIMQLIINVYTRMNASYALTSFWDIQHFLSQVFFTCFLSGLIFQIPILVSALIRLHILSYQQFASKRKVVYAVLVIVAIILPTTDLLSLILEVLPLFFLFELGLLLNR